MKKRLLAVLLACCMAAGMANAVFAADELPATAESAAAIAPADPDPPAPEPEMETEPTPAADPEPEIEAEPTPAADPAATPETARTLVMDALLAAPDTAAQTAVVTSAELVDSIRTDGCFTAKVNGSTDRLDGAVYTWYRSKDGTNWEEVPQQLCSGDAWNITPGSEHRLNAAWMPALPVSGMRNGCTIRSRSPAPTAQNSPPRPCRCPTASSCRTAALKRRILPG